MKLIVVRHGQTESNVAGVWQGQSDGVLTKLGESQAKKTGLALKSEKITFVYCSPLGRARRTSELICDVLDVGFEQNNLLMEANLGSLEGTKAEVDWNFRPDDVEPFSSLIIRAKSFLAFLFKKHSSDDVILIVSHGGLIRALVSAMRGVEVYEDFPLPNCSLSVFDYVGGVFLENAVGDVCHLNS